MNYLVPFSIDLNQIETPLLLVGQVLVGKVPKTILKNKLLQMGVHRRLDWVDCHCKCLFDQMNHIVTRKESENMVNKATVRQTALSSI